MAEILTQAQRCDTRLPGRELSRHGIDNMKGNRETLWIKIQLFPLSLSRLDRICGGMAAMGPGYRFADCGICDSGGGDGGGNGHGSHVSRSRGHGDAHVGTSGHSGMLRVSATCLGLLVVMLTLLMLGDGGGQ